MQDIAISHLSYSITKPELQYHVLRLHYCRMNSRFHWNHQYIPNEKYIYKTDNFYIYNVVS
jgi:hypothetical protein